MTAGMETTVDTVNTRHTMDQSAAPSSIMHTEMAQRLPDYREPPLGFFEGDPGPVPDTQTLPSQQQQQMHVDVATGRMI